MITHNNLKDKLRMYNHQLTKCKSATYDQIRSSGDSGNKEEERVLMLLDKINEYEKKIEANNIVFKEFYSLEENISSDLAQTVLYYMARTQFRKSEIAKIMKVSRSTLYTMIKKIEVRYKKLMR
jgi:DNA-binding NtrC family response regulator